MARSTRRQRFREDSEVGTWALAGLVFLVVILAVGGLIYLRFLGADRPELDAVTLCPVEGGARSTTVVLLDATDPWPDVVNERVVEEVTTLVGQVPEYGLLELRSLDPALAGGRVLFSKCNPGDGSNLSEITANPRLAHQQWQVQFIAPVKAALAAARTQPQAQTSPIIATVQRLGINAFRDGRPGTLVLVSDMIEHTPEYSQYRKGRFPYDEYQRSAAFRRQRTDLHGALVTILYIERLRNSPDHLEFWVNWVADNNGVWGEAVRIDGAQP